MNRSSLGPEAEFGSLHHTGENVGGEGYQNIQKTPPDRVLQMGTDYSQVINLSVEVLYVIFSHLCHLTNHLDHEFLQLEKPASSLNCQPLVRIRAMTQS